MWRLSESEGWGGTLPGAALGTVVAVDGAEVTVEVIGAGGAATVVAAPAIHHALYAENDRVLVIFRGRDPSTAVVAGRVGFEEDAIDPAVLLRADGTTPLLDNWDVGGGVYIALDEVRARSTGGLLLADALGVAGIFVAQGGSVGVGTQSPEGVLHLWDGVAGHLCASFSGVSATAVVMLSAGAINQYVRVDALISNGTTRAFLAFSLQVGGVTTQSIVTGSDTWQVRLNGNGSMDVRRTAGSGTGTVVVRAMWI